jgi:hypothetical protein
MERGTGAERLTLEPHVSMRLATSKGPIDRECIAIAELAALQTGQI